MSKIHPCENCPEIQEQFNRKLKLYEEELIEHPEYKDEIIYEIYSCCGCDKLGASKLWLVNPCGCEEYSEPKNRKKKLKNKKRKLNKYEREQKYKNRLKRQAPLFHGVYLREEKFTHGKGWVAVNKPYYKRFYRSKRISYKYLKKYSNRVVRNSTNIANRSGYKRCFDFWWNVD